MRRAELAAAIRVERERFTATNGEARESIRRLGACIVRLRGDTARLRRVLVVDDDATFARVVQRSLEAEGYEAATAGTAEEALAMLDAQQWGGLLVDLVLPGMSGVEFVGHARAKSPAIVVLVSGYYPDQIDAVRATTGAHAALCKPLPEGEPVATLRRLLGPLPPMLAEVH